MRKVTVKFTGDLYAAVGTFAETLDLNAANLRELVDMTLERHRIREMMLDKDGRLLPRARILVNGRYMELLQGWDTPIRDGDTVSLMMPGTFVA